MADVKMTKNGLRDQQHLLGQLQKYLPTLQLKKTLLLTQVMLSKNRIERIKDELFKKKQEVLGFSYLLTSSYENELLHFVGIKHIQKTYENIAGVEIPNFEKVIFEEASYDLLDTPAWFDPAIEKLKNMISAKEKLSVEEEKKRSLEKELKDVSIRVNLFEKILIPRTIGNIKKIKIFLGDQELAAISQAKVAKLKKALA